MNYAKKIKIRDIVTSTYDIKKNWEIELKNFVNNVMTEDNIEHSENAVSERQERVWMDCFKFIQENLTDIDVDMQEFELIFEYSIPGTVHERPDVFLLTNSKVISLEFKKKEAPQMDDNKDDVEQANEYKEWLENHHKVTKDRNLEVKSYLVCTHPNAVSGYFRGVNILTKDNFKEIIEQELYGEEMCSFQDEWLDSSSSEMPDMIEAMNIMYKEGKIPYISDVNRKCLNAVNEYIEDAKINHKKILILINGVPGAGKTAVGQNVALEQNKNRQANAAYLSGNGPLIEVLKYQIDQIGNKKHMAENVFKGMKEFKAEYFDTATMTRSNVPEQSILIFDEAQRAWDTEKLNRGFSEPEGLFRVGERIFNERGYVVLIGLYGNGQIIYKGEEKGIKLWEDALNEHTDWNVVVSQSLGRDINVDGDRKIIDNSVYLPISLRANFIDCSKWVEETINRANGNFIRAQEELASLQNTSMRICITRNFEKVRERVSDLSVKHPKWKYGLMISNFAEAKFLTPRTGWSLGFGKKNNTVKNGEYGSWFVDKCKKLEKACSVYGNQGLELDCPIVIFGGDYIRQNDEWIAKGYWYDEQKNCFEDPETIVENNYRVLLTRSRKQMILFIPNHSELDETYNYFVEMGMDVL